MCIIWKEVLCQLSISMPSHPNLSITSLFSYVHLLYGYWSENIWRSGSNLWESDLFFHCVGFWTEVRLSGLATSAFPNELALWPCVQFLREPSKAYKLRILCPCRCQTQLLPAQSDQFEIYMVRSRKRKLLVRKSLKK